MAVNPTDQTRDYMTIAFATTLSLKSSTMIGRVLPLAEHLAVNHRVHILHLGARPKRKITPLVPATFHKVGRLPFTRSDAGKTRLHGIPLLMNLAATAGRTFLTLFHLKPTVIIIIKPHPHNVAGVVLARFFLRGVGPHPRLILDVDDFELTANQLSSLAQRAGIHWAERTAVRLADAIVTVSPFLTDRYRHLSSRRKNQPPVRLIPTGVTPVVVNPVPLKEPHLTYIGSVSKSSGHRVDLLPDILTHLRRQFPTLILTIAGSGDDLVSLQKKFSEQKLSSAVRWTGRFGAADLPHLLQQTTILIDPIDTSITQRAKSSSRVTLAAITGLPIVTSNVGIRPELLPPHLHPRFFAQPADPADYAAKIADLLTHPLSEADRASLRDSATPFIWEKLASHYESLLTP